MRYAINRGRGSHPKTVSGQTKRLLHRFKPATDFGTFKYLKATDANYILLDGRSGMMAIRKSDDNIKVGAFGDFIPIEDEEVYWLWHNEYEL